MTYTAARLQEWNALVAMYGTTLTHKGVSYTCIADPQEASKEMTPGPYEAQRPARFDMLASDFTLSGIGLRSTITAGGVNYEVYSHRTDDVEPTVVLMCNRKQ